MEMTVNALTWDVVDCKAGHYLVTPNGPDGPYGTAREAREARYVEWDDIKGESVPDEWGEAPWKNCDGLEHGFHLVRYGYDRSRGSYAWVNRRDTPGYIEITDKTIRDWGVGYPGCSKQVMAEAIAARRREATEQLVSWYQDGWDVWLATARYGDYTDCVGGIYDEDEYAGESVEECRHNVADQLESDGYTVVGRPERAEYNRVDAFRDRIKRNMVL